MEEGVPQVKCQTTLCPVSFILIRPLRNAGIALIKTKVKIDSY